MSGEHESRRTYPPRNHRLGPYLLRDRLGLGGMAEVYAADRPGPHGFVKRVAVKRILPHIAADPAFVSMFIQEAALAAQLSHPNIVQVFDFGDDGEHELYLAMELIEGTTVSRLLRVLAARGEAVPLEVALHLTASAARALSHAHGLRGESGELMGLVHRDVSPGNLLLSRDGHLKLTDFGIAYVCQAERHTLTDHLRGKIGYMSPEQVSGAELTDRSDVFTLCVVLAEMLLGESLFSRGSDLDVLLRIRDVDLTVLLKTRRRIPSDVRRLLLHGLSLRPEARPSAYGLSVMIEEIMARRGLAGDGAAATVRLLQQHDLAVGRGEPLARDSERPTGLLALDGSDAHAIEVGARVSPSQLGKAPLYCVPSLGSGTVHFPELVRLCTTGVVDAQTAVRCGRADLKRACELPELSRFFSTPALQWAKEEISRPRLRGELRAAILLPLIHSLSANRETGMLYLEAPGRRKKIYFVEGRPDFVASDSRSELLGDYLVAHDHCMEMELDMALAMMPHFEGRLGDALVNLGVLRPVELYRAVTSQVRSRYLQAFNWRSGQWRYVRSAQSREETYPIEQDAQVLMRDAAAALDPSELEAALSPLWEKVLRPSVEPPAPLTAYQMPDSWRWVIEQARGEGTVGSIFGRCATQSGLDSEEAMRALFLGVSCQLLEAVV